MAQRWEAHRACGIVRDAIAEHPLVLLTGSAETVDLVLCGSVLGAEPTQVEQREQVPLALHNIVHKRKEEFLVTDGAQLHGLLVQLDDIGRSSHEAPQEGTWRQAEIEQKFSYKVLHSAPKQRAAIPEQGEMGQGVQWNDRLVVIFEQKIIYEFL